MSTFQPPGHCPTCGEYVEENAVACPSCGSCPRTGWNEDSAYDGLDLPTEEGEPSGAKATGVFWKAVVVVGLVALLLYVFVAR